MTSETSKLPRWAYTFIPNKDAKVTPIILSANVIMWLIMIITGVSPMLPGTEDALKWGATSADDVTSGEYWRLFTSNYIHYGIIHLAVNMLSLNNVGRMLEQFIGPWRFALLYTFTGICGSAASIWWNPYAVGAGASGAILGLVGVLLAILTTNLIEKTVRMKMLRSMAISAGLMILIGLQANVDNAAHLGGLGAGMIGGYFIFPELKAHYYQRKKQYLGLIASLLLIAGVTGWFLIQAQPSGLRTPEQMTTDFNQRETIALTNFESGVYDTPEKIDKNLIALYEYGNRQLDSINEQIENPDSRVMYEKIRAYRNAQTDYLITCKKVLAGDSSLADDVIQLRGKALEAKQMILQ